MLTRFAWLALGLTASLASTGGCAGEESTPSASQDLKNRGAEHWIYAGMLPALDSPAVALSVKSHTARISGLLPEGFEGELPFYVQSTMDEDGRERIDVVYPVATGKWRQGPGSYPDIWAIPFVPNTTKAPWGGFPFLEYHHERGLAMHGPITSWDGEWQLLRGPVSHGCNRMQGEHVVELTHMLGIDMSVPHIAEEVVLDVSVFVTEDYDSIEDELVDVDFPAQDSVDLPSGPNVRMFQSWDSRDFPQWVCAHVEEGTPPRAEGAGACEHMPPPTRDALTGQLLEETL